MQPHTPTHIHIPTHIHTHTYTYPQTLISPPTHRTRLLLVIELMEGGELFDSIKSLKHFSEDMVVNLTTQVLMIWERKVVTQAECAGGLGKESGYVGRVLVIWG